MQGDPTSSGVVTAVLQIVMELKAWAEFYVDAELEDKQHLSIALKAIFKKMLKKRPQAIQGWDIDISAIAGMLEGETPAAVVFSLQTKIIQEFGFELE